MPITIPQFFAATGQPLQTGLAKIIERYSKVAPLLGVKQIPTLAYTYPKETSLGGVGTRIINQPFGTIEGGSVTPQGESVVIGGRPVKTDYRLNELQPTARAGEISRAMRAVTRWMDDQIVNGVAANSTPQAQQMNGFRARCAGKQLLSAGLDGGQLTMDLFNSLVDAVVDQGHGIHVIMNKTLYRKFKYIVLGEAGGAALTDVTTELAKYENVQLHVVGEKLDGTSTLDFNETQGASNITASIYAFAPGNDDIELSGCKLLFASNSIEVIPEGTRDSMVVDVLECAFGLAVYDDTAIARLQGVLKPTYV